MQWSQHRVVCRVMRTTLSFVALLGIAIHTAHAQQQVTLTFCLDWVATQVWDGSIAFDSGFVLGMAREPDYRNHLVVRYIFEDQTTWQQVTVEDPAFYWQPTPPPSGFLPGVYASPLPPP